MQRWSRLKIHKWILPGEFVKAGRGNCYFKSEDSNIKLQEHEKSRIHETTKDHKSLFGTDAKGMESFDLTDKEFRITVKKKTY